MKLRARPAAAARGRRRSHGVGADRRAVHGRGAARGRARRARADVHGRGPPLRARARHRAAAARATPYEVALDGEVVWPEPDSRVPAERPAHPHARRRGEDRVRLLPRRRAARAAAHAAQGRAPGRARGRRAARVRAGDARPSRPRSGRTRCCCSATRSTPTRSTRHVEDALDGEASSRYDDYVALYTRRVERAGHPLAVVHRARAR